MNLAMSRQLRAEKNAHPELTVAVIADRTGISVGTLNRVFAKDESSIRDINISVIVALAEVFGLTAEELVEAAVRRAERMSAAAGKNNVTEVDFDKRRDSEANAAHPIDPESTEDENYDT